MSLTFIQGLPGSGKTENCFREIVECSSEENNNSLIYLVPEQFSLQSEKNLVARLPNRSMTQVQVLSFQRLAYHIFAEQGRKPGRFINDIGKAMLLRKIIYDLSGQLSFFTRAVDKQGFVDRLSDTVTEFYRYGVTPNDLKAGLEVISDDGARKKMNDLYLIFNNYISYLENKYISSDEVLDILADKVQEAMFLIGATIWVDGFTSFTPQELKVITALLKKTDIKLTAAVNEKSNFFDRLAVTDFFHETKSTINRISKIAKDIGVIVNEPIFLQNTVRYDAFPELRYFVEKYFVRNSSYARSVDNISILPASDRYTEITNAAAGILELVRDKGYRFKDIALLTGDMNAYRNGIAVICGSYGIPVFMDNKNDILSHPLSEVIRSAIDVVAFNFSFESMLRFLRTGLTRMDREDIDLLENYMLAYGIKGYKWKLSEWHFGFGGVDDNYNHFNKEEMNRWREIIMADLEPLAGKLSPEKKYSVRELSTGVFDMLYRMDVINKIEQWVTEATENGDNQLAKQHGQIWGLVCDIFDKLVEILGDEQVSVKEFGKILEAGFSETNMGSIPPSVDQVLVGDLIRTRLPEIKALFVLGANDGILPVPIEESGLISDDERMTFKSAGIELGADSRQRICEERFLIYSALGKPKERLIISYSMNDKEGKGMRPAEILLRLKKAFPALTEGSLRKDVTLPEPMLGQMGGILKRYINGGEIDPSEIGVYGWLSQNPEYKQKMQKINSYLLSAGHEESLSQQSARNLYGEEIITAASRIEKYMECPFAYFMQYNLNADERKVYSVSAMDIGSLFHNVLEEFSKLLNEQGYTWRSVPVERLDEMVDHCVDELAPKMGDSVLLSSARNQYVIERVRRVCKRSIWALWTHVQKGLFEPSAAELAFKNDSSLNETPITGITVSLNDKQRLVLTGRIDRVDIMDSGGNKYIKIIDYKSGNMKFDLSDVYFGMQMQLILYLDAMIKNSGLLFPDMENNMEILPGGVFYFNINDPIIDSDGEEDNEKLEDMLLKTFKMSGLVLAEEEAVKGLDSEIQGESKIIPVSVLKSGSFGGRSSIKDREGFSRLREHVVQKMKEAGNEMANGSIAPFPYKKGLKTGCDYCHYGAVCGIEILEKKRKYNVVPKVE